MKPTGASASTFLVSDLAADALLQQRERRDPAVLPDDDLAVEHGAVGQRAARARRPRESAR